MKNVLSLLLVAGMLISVSGCSSSEHATISSSNISSTIENTSSIEDTSSEEIVSSEETPSSQPQKETSKPISSQPPKTTSKPASSQPKKDAPKPASSQPPKATSKAASSQLASSNPAIRETVSIPFMEGSSLAKMMDVLDKNGVSKRDDLLKAVNNFDFSYYPLVGKIVSSSQRCFKLEGYLFPDTYQFYKGEKAEDAIGRFLKVTEKKITDEYRKRATELGYSMDQIITIASIVEKEVGDTKQMSTVASVFYNRLNQGQKLQSDATINYVERSIKPFISDDINRYNSYYNTYKCKALPAGPICNPGIAAIKAALYPEQTGYLFFVSDKDKKYYYSSTYEEHRINCQTAGVTIE